MRREKIMIYSHNQAMIELIQSRLASPVNIIATAMSTTEARTLMEDEQFHIIILAGHRDLDNVLDLLNFANQLEHRPSSIVVEINADRRALLQTLNAGCSYFIDGTAEVERIEGIVSFLMNEKRELIKRSEQMQAREFVRKSEGPPSDKALSRRENEILYTMLRGMSNREISKELEISEKTVKNHLWKIYRKFDVDNRTQLFNHLILSCPCMKISTSPVEDRPQHILGRMSP
ncbi:MAG: response regulator transcription factor [Bacteroidales bacterium]|nr:response regulator transcription factor [Candidatus Latescibacterota bacterium]